MEPDLAGTAINVEDRDTNLPIALLIQFKPSSMSKFTERNQSRNWNQPKDPEKGSHYEPQS